MNPEKLSDGLIHFIARSASGIPCECGGYADRVDCTQEEIANSKCGRSYECCARAFVCRVCKRRIVGQADPPEMD